RTYRPGPRPMKTTGFPPPAVWNATSFVRSATTVRRDTESGPYSAPDTVSSRPTRSVSWVCSASSAVKPESPSASCAREPRRGGGLARGRRASPCRRRCQDRREEKALRRYRKDRPALPHLHDRLPHQLPDRFAERARSLSPAPARREYDGRSEFATGYGVLHL